jgi:hypothetical protein
MPSSELLHRALDEAFRLHLQKLFNVLMVEPTDASLARFMKGLTVTSEMYDRIEKEIELWEP